MNYTFSLRKFKIHVLTSTKKNGIWTEMETTHCASNGCNVQTMNWLAADAAETRLSLLVFIYALAIKFLGWFNSCIWHYIIIAIYRTPFRINSFVFQLTLFRSYTQRYTLFCTLFPVTLISLYFQYKMKFILI